MFSQNSFLKLATPIIEIILELREKHLIIRHHLSLFQLLMNHLRKFEKVCNQAGFPENQIHDAMYAFAATLDEIIMDTSWEHQHEWAQQTLQLSLFGEHSAGDEFYKRLESYRLNIMNNLEIVELYFVCMNLGFKGMYKMHGDDKWHALLTSMRRQLSDFKPDKKEPLYIAYVPNGQGKPSSHYIKSVKGLCLMGLVVSLLIYGVFYIRLTQRIDQDIRYYEDH